MSPSPEHRRAAVEAAARVVRENMEAFAVHARRVHGADIIIDKTTAGEMNLCGACAIASQVLWRALRAAGFRDATFVRGWYSGSNHCWVEVEGLVVFEPIGHALICGYEHHGYGGRTARLNENALEDVPGWYSGQSPAEPKYQEDLGIMEGLALDAALAELTIEELDSGDWTR